MEELINPTPPSEISPENSPVVSSKRKYWIFGGVGIILLLLSICLGIFIGSKNTQKGKSAQVPTIKKTVSPADQKQVNDFFFFSIPKPVKDVSFLELPNDATPRSVIKIENSLWFSGDGSIIEYDIKSGKLVSYTNPKKANCNDYNDDMVFVSGYLYVVCRIDNIEDAFGTTRILESPLFTGHQGVVKIDPKKHTLVHIYSKADGLLNGYNYKLYPDGDMIWVSTFNGLGRINTKTDHVDFYTNALGFDKTSNARSYDVWGIKVDKNTVWAWVSANADSQGGIAVFDKAKNVWQAFGPKELTDTNQQRIDFEFSENGQAIKLIPGGIQVAFRESRPGPDGSSEDFLVEKAYLYATGKWTKLPGDRQATGSTYEETANHVKATYPPSKKFKIIEQEGLAQIQMVGNDTIYEIDGRNNLVLSQMIDSKRYILTNATIDIIDDAIPFRQILIKLGEKITDESQYSFSGDTNPNIQFLIDPETLFGVIVALTPCGGGDGLCEENKKIWLVNLKEKSVVKVYPAKTNTLPHEQALTELSLKKEGTILIVTGNDGKDKFTIDTNTSTLYFPPQVH